MTPTGPTPAGLLDSTPRRSAQRRTVRTLAASHSVARPLRDPKEGESSTGLLARLKDGVL